MHGIHTDGQEARDAARRRWRLSGLLAFGWWSTYALLYAAPYYFSRAGTAQPITWTRALGGSLLGSYLWAVFTLLIFALAWRFPLVRRRWPRSLAIHAPASVVLALAEIAAGHLFGRMGWFEGGTFSERFVASFSANVLEYWLIAGVGHAVDLYDRYRQRELAASRAEAGLALARLEVLRAQLQPHFLFNTLHAVGTLMHRDTAAAERMIAQLSDLLRATLASAGRQEATLAEELLVLEPYLEIERTRFGDRLTVEVSASPEAREAVVPYLILQPLVENAIRHGIARRAGAGRVEVWAERRGDRLEVRVRDDGRGPAARAEGDGEPGTGIGLANARARLKALHGPAAMLELLPAEGGGAVALLVLPFRRAPRGTPSPEAAA